MKERRGVIHVGAHEGQERNWYIQQGFNKVIWFEPNKEVFDRLQKRIEIVSGHIAYNLGVHDTLEKTILHISNNDGQSSSILNLGTHTFHHPNIKYVLDQEIKMIRLDDFFKIGKHNVTDFNFLNIDVQGVELNVIKSFGSLITKMDYIYTEVNEEHLYKNCCLIHEVDEYLKDFGFRRECTHMTPKRWGDAFYLKIK
ncbi:MAG: FkbM family methyltransferase [Patescibacteria group bacterium]